MAMSSTLAVDASAPSPQPSPLAGEGTFLRLEDIGKTFSGFLEPPEPCPGDRQTGDGVNAQPCPIRQFAKDHDGAALLDHECERVEHQPKLEFFGERGYGVEHGGDEHQYRGKDAYCLPDIAHKYAERGKEPCHAKYCN